MGVLAVLCLTYIQECLFTVICPCAWLSHQYRVILSLGRGAFWKIKEKKIEKRINIDLAIIASQCSERRFMTYQVLLTIDLEVRAAASYRPIPWDPYIRTWFHFSGRSPRALAIPFTLTTLWQLDGGHCDLSNHHLHTKQWALAV